MITLCEATVILSEAEWATLTAVPEADHEPEPWLRCELDPRQHHQCHYALAQSWRREQWWLRWCDDFAVRDLSMMTLCTRAHNSGTSELCTLFDDHPGRCSYEFEPTDAEPLPPCPAEAIADPDLAAMLRAFGLTVSMAHCLRTLFAVEQVWGLRSRRHLEVTTPTSSPQLLRAEVSTPGLARALATGLVFVPHPAPYRPPLTGWHQTRASSVAIQLSPRGRHVAYELLPFWES